MAFPINSTSVQTSPCKRVGRVMQRANVARLISHAGCYNCRTISGSTVYSQHAWGNALDLFPENAVHNDEIADAVVYQAKHRTKANRFRRLRVAEVIDHLNRRIWTPAGGWRVYGGTIGPHVHVTASPKRYGTPDCA